MKLLSAAILIRIVLVVPVSIAQADETPPQATDLRSLQLERIKVLTERYELLRVQSESGNLTIAELLKAHNQLLDAQLQTATGKDERLNVLRQSLENLREIEKEVTARYEIGVARKTEVLAATADRLSAEIRIARELEPPAAGQKADLKASDASTDSTPRRNYTVNTVQCCRCWQTKRYRRK